jgi:hypothetical protein
MNPQLLIGYSLQVLRDIDRLRASLATLLDFADPAALGAPDAFTPGAADLPAALAAVREHVRRYALALDRAP